MWRVLVAASCVMISPAASKAQDRSFEQASTAFVQRYLQEWSDPTQAALAYMDTIYPDRVEFYGKTLTHAALMNLKRRFAERWPERTLTLRPGSVHAACDPAHLCTVKAIFDWHYRSRERQAVSSGSARLTLKLQDGMTILSENGSVIPSNPNAAIALAQPPPAPPVAPRPAPPVAIQPAPSVAPQPPPDTPTAAIAAPAGPQPEPDLQQEAANRRQQADIAALRNTYMAHTADKDWIAAWLAQKRDFSGEATFVGSTEDQAGPGPNDLLRTDGFASAVGTIACINPDNDASLKVGEKVNIHGVITVFIENVMYLGQCSIQPG